MVQAQSQSVYVDYAAATPMDARVLSAMQPYFTDLFYNPSNIDTAARSVQADLEAARAKVAFWLGARPGEIIFTAGATEANNLAIRGIMQMYADAECIVSAIEHDSILSPVSEYPVATIPVQKSGRVELQQLTELITDTTILVSVQYANNEIGTVQPITEIAQHIKQIRMQRKKDGNSLPIYLHTDAAQAAQYLDLHVDRLGVDLLSLNGGKIYGPKQTGILYVRGGISLQPQIRGGGQEYGMRSGTENVSGAIGLATALEIAQKMRGEETKRVQALRDSLITKLIDAFPEAELNGGKNHRLPNNVSITFDGLDGERLIMMLDERGVICNTGAACSAQKDESSHVIKALGKSESQALGTLRFTLGRQNTEADIDSILEALNVVIPEARRLCQ